MKPTPPIVAALFFLTCAAPLAHGQQSTTARPAAVTGTTAPTPPPVGALPAPPRSGTPPRPGQGPGPHGPRAGPVQQLSNFSSTLVACTAATTSACAPVPPYCWTA